jgi:hypothetical protein
MNIRLSSHVLNRLFPRQADNRPDGHRAALWLLGLFVTLKLVMSVNSILNTASVATGGDGLPLDGFSPAAARTVLMLFALMSLGQLTLAVIALAILIRFRAMVPFIYLVLLCEHLARRFIVHSYAVPRTETTPVGWYVNLGLLVLLTIGLLLSLVPSRRRESRPLAASPSR